MRRANINKTNAQAIAELPVVLWLLFLLLTIPLVDLTAFSLRYNYLLVISRDAAQAACRAKTFQTDVSSQELSAGNTANAAAIAAAAAFPDVTVNSVNTRIVITNISSGVTTRQSVKLAQPADVSANVYQIETVINGQTNPLLVVPQGYWSFIPGLTAPISVSVASRAYAEYPQGLNQ